MAKRPNPELVGYIEKHLAKGFSMRDIKRKLAEVGHPIEAIEDAAQFVLAKQPPRRVPRFMIVYGMILIVVVVGFLYFAWFKATQQVAYKETVAGIQKNQTYLGRTDVDLLKMAAAGDMAACRFIKTHNLYYACTGKYWERGDCLYESLVGESAECWTDKALRSKNFSLCNRLINGKSRDLCLRGVFSGIASRDSPEDCGGNSICLNFVLNQSANKKDVSFCDLYAEEDGREGCLVFFAQVKDDKEVCTRISSLEKRLGCLAGFVSSLEEAEKLCDGYGDYAPPYFQQDLSQTPLAGLDQTARTRLQCFYFISILFVEKDIYTCEQVLEYVKENAGSAYLKHFNSLYKFMSTSSKARDDHNEYYRCLS
jgi:hypothetical protein